MTRLFNEIPSHTPSNIRKHALVYAGYNKHTLSQSLSLQTYQQVQLQPFGSPQGAHDASAHLFGVPHWVEHCGLRFGCECRVHAQTTRSSIDWAFVSLREHLKHWFYTSCTKTSLRLCEPVMSGETERERVRVSEWVNEWERGSGCLTHTAAAARERVRF